MLKKISNNFFRLFINNKKRKKILNKNPTIISSNCNGGVILHDLGLKFNSPTVNLFIESKDFIKLVKNLEYYMASELYDITSENDDYPKGMLDDITINFFHYTTFKEAKEKWERRVKRIDKNNIFIMMTDRDGCKYEDILEFDKLEYTNKIIFTNKRYNEIKSSYYISGFENSDSVGILSDFKGLFGYRYIDEFDYVKWINNI